MIGRIYGKLLLKKPPMILIDTGGLCYDVEVSMHTFYHLPEEQAPVGLHTHFIVREESQQLYGFLEPIERQLFRALIKVNGVGPKLAMTLLSALNPQQFAECIANQQISRLVKIPGVGKKTAERLIIEMKDTLSKWYQSDTQTMTQQSTSMPTTNDAVQDAICALETLGYSSHLADRLIKGIADSNLLTREELIRQALKTTTEENHA